MGLMTGVIMYKSDDGICVEVTWSEVGVVSGIGGKVGIHRCRACFVLAGVGGEKDAIVCTGCDIAVGSRSGLVGMLGKRSG